MTFSQGLLPRLAFHRVFTDRALIFPQSWAAGCVFGLNSFNTLAPIALIRYAYYVLNPHRQGNFGRSAAAVALALFADTEDALARDATEAADFAALAAEVALACATDATDEALL
eukprot:Opistho-2@60619